VNIAAVIHTLTEVQDLDPAAKLAVVVVAARCRDKDTFGAWLSLSDLSRDLGMASRSSAREAVERAVKKGALSVHKVSGIGTLYGLGCAAGRAIDVRPPARPARPTARNRAAPRTHKEKERSRERDAALARHPASGAAPVDSPPNGAGPPHGAGGNGWVRPEQVEAAMQEARRALKRAP
jgi:hypothetical protein